MQQQQRPTLAPLDQVDLGAVVGADRAVHDIVGRAQERVGLGVVGLPDAPSGDTDPGDRSDRDQAGPECDGPGDLER